VSGQQHAPSTLYPMGKTRYPFYRRLGGLQGWSGRAENLVPTGIRSLDHPARKQSLYRLSYQPTNAVIRKPISCSSCELFTFIMLSCFFHFTGSSFSFSQEDGSAIRHKHSHMSGKPLSLRRGPGRPRKDRPCTRSSKKSIGLKLKRWKRYT